MTTDLEKLRNAKVGRRNCNQFPAIEPWTYGNLTFIHSSLFAQKFQYSTTKRNSYLICRNTETVIQISTDICPQCRGYRGGSPTAVRPSDPTICGSCPLVTPYYCRLGDLLCFMCVYRFVCALLSLHVCFCCFRSLICLL